MRGSRRARRGAACGASRSTSQMRCFGFEIRFDQPRSPSQMRRTLWRLIYIYHKSYLPVCERSGSTSSTASQQPALPPRPPPPSLRRKLSLALGDAARWGTPRAPSLLFRSHAAPSRFPSHSPLARSRGFDIPSHSPLARFRGGFDFGGGLCCLGFDLACVRSARRGGTLLGNAPSGRPCAKSNPFGETCVKCLA